MQLIEESQAPPEIQQMYAEIKRLWGLPFVPNLYKAMASDPRQLRDHTHHLSTLRQCRHLDAPTVHLIALAVAATRECNYCINFHTAQLQKHGLSQEAIAEAMMAIFYFNEVDTIDADWALEPDVNPT